MTKVTRGVELKYIMESFIDQYNIKEQNQVSSQSPRFQPMAMRYKIFDSKICQRQDYAQGPFVACNITYLNHISTLLNYKRLCHN